jgi:hypothetical protein
MTLFMFPEQTEVRIVQPGDSTFTKEARHIQKCALRGDTRVVKLGPIIFFCANGDAWMLDPEDHFARCLMRDGERLPPGIIENRKQFSIEWNADYQIEGGVFTVADRTGSVRSIIGYPTRLIEDQPS